MSASKEHLRSVLDKVQVYADNKGLDALSMSAVLMHDMVESAYDAESDLSNNAQAAIINWKDQVKVFLADPDAEGATAELIASMPEQLRDDMYQLYGDQDSDDEVKLDEIEPEVEEEIDAFEEPSVVSFPEFEEEWPDVPGADDDSDFLSVLANEFIGLIPQFGELKELMLTKPKLEVVQKKCGEIQEHVHLIQRSSADVMLEGFEKICGFIDQNLEQLTTIPYKKRFDCVDLLIELPVEITAHIEKPDSDELCMEIINTMEHQSWPKKLSYREEKYLLNALIEQLEVSNSENESKQISLVDEEHISLEMSDEATPDFIDAFFNESPEQAEILADNISKIIRGQDVAKNLLASQRVSHTLKGSANLLGVQGIANLAHYLEDTFEYLVNHNIAPNAELANVMQDSADTISGMIDALAAGSNQAPENSTEVLQSLLNWREMIAENQSLSEQQVTADEVIEKTESAPEETETSSLNQVSDDKADKPKQRNKDVIFHRKEVALDNSSTINEEIEEPVEEVQSESKNTEQLVSQAALAPVETLRVPRQLIDNILNMMGETSVAMGQMLEKLQGISDHGKSMTRHEKVLQTRRFELEDLINVKGLASNQAKVQTGTANSDDFDSLELDEYNELYGATHGYIEAVADNRMFSRNILDGLGELETLFVHQQRLNRSLQEMMMDTRMVSVETISSRLQRAVRQAARATGKNVDLNIYGENLEIDGEVLNKLTDPLMHLLRNAVDHGVEPIEQREMLGKDVTGKIQLKFEQQGNYIVVTCSDDGQGLDYDAILNKAIEKGLTESRQLDKEAIARLVLQPGFSTRSNATQVSGRGVGLDVVNSTIIGLKGNLRITDNLEADGTLIEMRIPVTLLTNHSIIVKAGSEQFAIPTNTLEQIFTPGAGRLEKVAQELCFNLDKNSYPIVDFTKLVGLQSKALENDRSGFNKAVLLLRLDDKLHAVAVDGVVSTVELLIKSNGAYIGDVAGVAGVSLLGNGQVIPVIDLPQLIRSDKGLLESVDIVSNQIEIESAKVLVVDDSLSARKSLVELISDAGHEVIEARDGQEALNLVEVQMPSLIVTDLEMPRLNGLDLVSKIRANNQTKNLPIIMVTSRTASKHRQQAISLGVNEYVSKPYDSDDVSLLVNKLLANSNQ